MTGRLDETWEGVVQAVQPRALLHRTFERRWVDYLGYVLIVEVESVEGFSVGLDEREQLQERYRAGDRVRGRRVHVADPMHDPAAYEGSRLQLLVRGDGSPGSDPPWRGIPPELEVYRERGFRQLASMTYQARCVGCIWGCEMAVEMTIDQGDSQRLAYRAETFCFGPRSCRLYRRGPPRRVPGPEGMTAADPDLLEEHMGHRGDDD